MRSPSSAAAPPARPASSARRHEQRRGPLSPLQRRYLAAADGTVSNFNVMMVWRLGAALQDATVGAALDALVRRHEALRSSLVAAGGALLQRVETAAPVTLAERRPGDADSSGEPLDALLRALAHAPFDLARDRSLRATLVRRGDGERLLVLVVPHIFCDAWSCDLLLREFRALCDAAPLPAVEIQQLDHALAALAPVPAATTAHWRTLLEPRRTGVELGRGDAWEWTSKPMHVERRRSLPADAVAAAAMLARSERATLMTVLLSAVADTLATRSHDTVTLAVMHANRLDPRLAATVGLVSDFLPLRVEVGDRPTSRELLTRTRAAWLTALSHQQPFGAIGEAIGREPEWPRTPLFDFTVNFTPAWVRADVETVHAEPFAFDHTRRDIRIASWPSGSFPAEFQLRQTADGSVGLCTIRVGDALSAQLAGALADELHAALARLLRG